MPAKSWNERTMRSPWDRATKSLRGALLHVHPFGAEVPRVFENRHARVFVPDEASALPRGATRDDDREATSLERSSGVGIADPVQAQLDQVRAANLIAAAAKLGHRGGRDGGAQQRWWHRTLCQKRKRLFNWWSKRRSDRVNDGDVQCLLGLVSPLPAVPIPIPAREHERCVRLAGTVAARKDARSHGRTGARATVPKWPPLCQRASNDLASPRGTPYNGIQHP